jgi:hypothetical protein
MKTGKTPLIRTVTAIENDGKQNTHGFFRNRAYNSNLFNLIVFLPLRRVKT